MEKIKFVYFSWNGRICRKTYWIYSIPIPILAFISGYYIVPINPVLHLLILIAVIYLSMMINIKRAHDRGRSGFFALLLVVPIISLWPLIEFGFIKGTGGENKFGLPDNTWGT